jgi:hypothetical protein
MHSWKFPEGLRRHGSGWIEGLFSLTITAPLSESSSTLLVFTKTEDESSKGSSEEGSADLAVAFCHSDTLMAVVGGLASCLLFGVSITQFGSSDEPPDSVEGYDIIVGYSHTFPVAAGVCVTGLTTLTV